MVLFQNLFQLRDQGVDFRAWLLHALLIDQSRMASRLAQAQQRFEYLKFESALGPIVGFRLEQTRAVVIPHLVVKFSLARFEIAINRLLGFGRQLFGDLPLGPAQDERAQGPRQYFAGCDVGIAPDGAEYRGTAEHAGIEKLEQAPELAEMVLHGRAAERQSVVGMDEPSSLRRERAGVLDRLRFVENAVIEPHVLEVQRVARQCPVRRNDEIVVAEVRSRMAPSDPEVL